MDLFIAYLVFGFLTFCVAHWYFKRENIYDIYGIADYIKGVVLPALLVSVFWFITVPVTAVGFFLDIEYED